jgi:S-adenosylmethionine-diacylglycerol 3-amino-3-carboxypropyl transferase
MLVARGENAARRVAILGDLIDQTVFDAIYSRSLVYNTCWEDPAVDRLALGLGRDDTLLVITSAGCNTLDYALGGAGRIHAVDANPRQTALLELKLAGIRALDFPDFFRLFGEGRHPHFRELLGDALRPHLSPFALAYWTRNAGWFSPRDPDGGFYFHGLSGLVARAFRLYLRLRPALAEALDRLLSAPGLQSQREIYDAEVHPRLWSRALSWTLSRQLTLSLLGVPHPQRKEVQRQHAEGVAGFIREAIEYVFRELPIADNYFWTLYIRGQYTPGCCPEYLRPDGFRALRAGAVDRVHPHTATVTQFLRDTRQRFSRWVLLDHMDWMSSYHPRALAEEWTELLRHADDGARVLFRSAHARPTYLEHLRVEHRGRPRPLAEILRPQEQLARTLQLQDRVHTYAGLHICDLAV